MKLTSTLQLILVLVSLCWRFQTVDANKKTGHEARIEDVNAKQLEKLIADKDYVAVFWCKFLVNKYLRKAIFNRILNWRDVAS